MLNGRSIRGFAGVLHGTKAKASSTRPRVSVGLNRTARNQAFSKPAPEKRTSPEEQSTAVTRLGLKAHEVEIFFPKKNGRWRVLLHVDKESFALKVEGLERPVSPRWIEPAMVRPIP